MEEMAKFLAARGGADEVDWEQVSVLAYYNQNILGTRGGATGIGERNARELRSLAEALDCMRAGNLPRAADILMGRFSAIEVAISQGSWTMARHLEAVGSHDMTSANAGLLEAAARLEGRRQKLEASAARARNG